MSPDTVVTIVDDLGALLLFTMILIVAASQISRAIYAVAAQSLLIAVAAAVLAKATGNVDLWVIAGVTLAVKAIALPWVLHWVVRRMNVRREVEPMIPEAATLALAVAVVVLSFDLSASLGPVRQAIIPVDALRALACERAIVRLPKAPQPYAWIVRSHYLRRGPLDRATIIVLVGAVRHRMARRTYFRALDQARLMVENLLTLGTKGSQIRQAASSSAPSTTLITAPN